MLTAENLKKDVEQWLQEINYKRQPQALYTPIEYSLSLGGKRIRPVLCLAACTLFNDDYERWKAFSDKHQLWDWTNLSTSRGEANLDFIEYFDIMTTPVMFLIDNTQKHTIIARQITLDELRSFFKK